MQLPRTAKTDTGKALEDTLAQLVFKEGGTGLDILQPYAQRILTSRLHVLKLLPLDRESLDKLDFDKLKASMPISAILEGLLYQHEFEKALYDNTYSRLKASDLTWEQMLASEVTSDEEFKNEIFVRLVEEKHGVEATSWKQLQELTGLKEFYLSYDYETGAFTKEKSTKKEAQDLANTELKDTFLKAMSYRYRRLLESILASGGKYKDLLEVSPTEFFLPESTKEETVATAITLFFGLMEGATGRISLRDIANQIEAPYSVILSAQDDAKF